MQPNPTATMTDLPRPPITFTARFRENVYCPGCADPIHGRTAHVYADVLWCHNCPPAHPIHLMGILALVDDPRLAAHWYSAHGLRAYHPHAAPVLPLDRLYDWLAANTQLPAAQPTGGTCPLLGIKLPPQRPTFGCLNGPLTTNDAPAPDRHQPHQRTPATLAPAETYLADATPALTD